MPAYNCKMPTAYLPQLGQKIIVNTNETLMSQLLAAHIPVASSCQGDGICGKCKMHIASDESLPEPSALEAKTLQANNAASNERLSCQLKPQGQLVVKTTYW